MKHAAPVARVLAILVLAALAGSPARSSATQSPEAPRLVVVLVVDQMRADYLERMASRWTRGMKRLLDNGAVFDENAYPYLQTVTCAGHATIGTGSFPSTHGIILNAWWRGTRNASCTADTAARAVGYEDGNEQVGHSAVQLLVPTLADRLRATSPSSRVVSISLKPRSAIMMAGKGGIVTWLDDNNKWGSSTAFLAAGDPDVQSFVDRHPRASARGEVWTRLLDVGRYTGVDAGVGEKPPAGWTSEFPHPMAGAPGTTEPQVDTLWENSPYADAWLGQLAAHMVERKQLGQGPHVDFLSVSFSSVDYVGHKFGPDSHEVQDTLLRLDLAMGDLLDALDRHVGKGRYLIGLSADHGVAPIPEARIAAGEPGGRITTAQLRQAANSALVAALGPGEHVARVEYTQVYLSAQAQLKVKETPALLELVVAALEKVPGVARAFASTGLEQQTHASDRLLRAAALSYVPGRSGQVVVLPQPFFVIGGADATTHGTHQLYDQRVPLIFFGTGVRPGHYQVPSTPADLAPTLASRIGLAMPGADGVAQLTAFPAP